ncbi:MAG: acyl-CoA thioesterase [Desulfobacteraceae bacterium]|jgi:acyl-CoA hydrolase
MEPKKCRNSFVTKTSLILPPDTNNHGTIFGGRTMSHIDEVAGLSAVRHARMTVVTASTDSVDFLNPIKSGQAICVEAFVTWTHNTSMEVFVKVLGENLYTGEQTTCTTAFLTFVALGSDGKPHHVPPVVPESDIEKSLHETAPERAKLRRERRERAKKFAEEFDFNTLKSK